MILDINAEFTIEKRYIEQHEYNLLEFDNTIKNNIIKHCKELKPNLILYNSYDNNTNKCDIGFLNDLSVFPCFLIFVKNKTVIIEKVFFNVENIYTKEKTININIKNIDTFFINIFDIGQFSFFENESVFIIDNQHTDLKFNFSKNLYKTEKIKKLKNLFLKFVTNSDNTKF